ncbi:MAG: 30S ribosomal protein S11 [Gammaproteobacteria bacterium]|nr:30S ribosomal protein S11 [Gammaproteobacteria bacterium]
MTRKQRGKRKISEGIAHIRSSFNNIVMGISDSKGDMLYQCSAGRVGFKGSRKGTPYAGQLVAEDAAKYVMENFDMRRIAVEVSGPGASRDSAIRALRNTGLDVIRLTDKTRLPHNGCRPRKKRRV